MRKIICPYCKTVLTHLNYIYTFADDGNQKHTYPVKLINGHILYPIIIDIEPVIFEDIVCPHCNNSYGTDSEKIKHTMKYSIDIYKNYNPTVVTPKEMRIAYFCFTMCVIKNMLDEFYGVIDEDFEVHMKNLFFDYISWCYEKDVPVIDMQAKIVADQCDSVLLWFNSEHGKNTYRKFAENIRK